MRLSVEFGEADALPFQVGEMGVFDDLVEILSLLELSVPLVYPAPRGLKQKGWEARRGKAYLVLQPYRDKAVKGPPAVDNLEFLTCAQRQHRRQACEADE